MYVIQIQMPSLNDLAVDLTLNTTNHNLQVALEVKTPCAKAKKTTRIIKWTDVGNSN